MLWPLALWRLGGTDEPALGWILAVPWLLPPMLLILAVALLLASLCQSATSPQTPLRLGGRTITALAFGLHGAVVALLLRPLLHALICVSPCTPADGRDWSLIAVAGLIAAASVMVLMGWQTQPKLDARRGFLASLLAYVIFAMMLGSRAQQLNPHDGVWATTAVILLGLFIMPIPLWLIPLTGALAGYWLGKPHRRLAIPRPSAEPMRRIADVGNARFAPLRHALSVSASRQRWVVTLACSVIGACVSWPAFRAWPDTGAIHAYEAVKLPLLAAIATIVIFVFVGRGVLPRLNPQRRPDYVLLLLAIAVLLLTGTLLMHHTTVAY